MPKNFGECEICACLTTRLMQVTNLATGAIELRICCRVNPAKHWRLATAEEVRLDEETT